MRRTIDKELLSHLLELETEQQAKVLHYIKGLLKGTKDYALELSAEQVISIQKGLKQIKEDKTVPHEKVRSRYKKWL